MLELIEFPVLLNKIGYLKVKGKKLNNLLRINMKTYQSRTRPPKTGMKSLERAPHFNHGVAFSSYLDNTTHEDSFHSITT